MTKKEETNSYKGWLNSDSFVKRSLAVFGYSMMGQIFIVLIIIVGSIVLGIIGGIFGLISKLF
jgi:hypothetical protein